MIINSLVFIYKIIYIYIYIYIAFGTPALARYAEMLDDGETGLLFQTYKMHLLHLHKNAISIDAREMPLMTVISQSIKFIADKAMEKLVEQVGKVVKAKIRWVLTVPALWSEEHKQFMRKAAVEAGIIEHINAGSLVLCLEVYIYIYIYIYI